MIIYFIDDIPGCVFGWYNERDQVKAVSVPVSDQVFMSTAQRFSSHC